MILLDEEDRELIQGKALTSAFHSPFSNTKYVTFYLNGKNVYLHRFVMSNILGRPLKSTERVDHINGNGLDNRRCNLRLCEHKQNMANQGSRKNTSSKYKGVTFYKRDQKWQAKISPNGKTIHLGYFDSEIEAAKAYNRKAVEVFGEFARLNDL